MPVDTIVLAVTIAIVIFVGYLLLKAYMPSLFKKPSTEAFVQRPMGPPMASPINMPAAPMPAPAPVIQQAPPVEERVVAPAGPSAPAATALPDTPATISPEAKPVDPYEDNNMEAPIHDSMRFPELSFGPGMDNKGIARGPASGVASEKSLTSESPFSPEFAQNGGIFMGSVSANDLSHDDSYALA